ncbi:alanine racemase [Knoellia flava TL1]|uniref:Pyridoxal phosphate homeostasis protein n=2 Tax=Knoellia flava TaxID=913969 RepID=A0A8H9FXS0_9MICO|nr:YggS family pyridoxal phosphate-dependent enzyme [Knoellia flava]KGN28986.1 alanine racemase [Knoellia flava TL1]GGB88920.1 YggS family pyridoxal phosphate enzyme [Knoellia flava]
MTSRRDELATRLGEVRARIDRAASAAGRDTGDVELVVVTKYFPASDVNHLVDLGVRHIGENKDQEAGAKVAEIARRDEVTVHFIGQLQSNKAGHVAAYADVVQSVDRAKIVTALDRGAQRHGRRLDVLLQVALDDDEGRGGARPGDVPALADLVEDAEALRLRGVMAVAPLGGDPRRAFARLREVADGIRAGHPDATWVSAGMSADLEDAVAEGATHLRVGTAILGTRPSLG